MADMIPAELLKAWEDAYLAQLQTARVGTLFRGTIHNLNGILQAFSMQSELFAMMFSKADTLLGEALNSAPEDNVQDKIVQTRELLQKRANTLRQVDEKISLSQEIMKSNVDISNVPDDGSAVTFHSLINDVVTFFNSHMFFKHKVKKDIRVDAELQIGESSYALSMALANLVENSIAAMEQNHDVEALFALRCFARDEKIIIEVEDNGVGVPPHIHETLFQEFVSATPGRPGLGLYLARKMIADLGGEIEIVGLANPTVFEISMPMGQEKA